MNSFLGAGAGLVSVMGAVFIPESPRAQKLTALGCIEPFTTVIASINHIFLAEELVFDPLPGRQEDILAPQWVSFAAAMDMLEAGKITHAASCVALLKTAALLRERQRGK